jgi:hypothetical protein
MDWIKIAAILIVIIMVMSAVAGFMLTILSPATGT